MTDKGERVPPRRQAGEYLANERTFLAWVRTSITIMSFGFIVAKFNVWLYEVVGSGSAKINSRLANSSLPIGVAMMALGAVLVALAAWRYGALATKIEKGEIKADRPLIFLVTGLVILLTAATITYVLLTTEG